VKPPEREPHRLGRGPPWRHVHILFAKMRHPTDGRVQSCELRDDSKVGAGWDVLMLQDDEPLFSRRCVDDRGARDVAVASGRINVAGVISY
jgi:hypothetical protein